MNDWRTDAIDAATRAVRDYYATNVEVTGGGVKYVADHAADPDDNCGMVHMFFRSMAWAAFDAIMRGGELELAKQLYVARIGELNHDHMRSAEGLFRECLVQARAATAAVAKEQP